MDFPKNSDNTSADEASWSGQDAPPSASDVSDLTVDWGDEDPLIQTQPKRKRLSPSIARKAHEDRTRGWTFTLNHTRDEDGQPTEALVRRVNMMDKDMLASLPKAIQQKLFELQIERARRQQKNEKEQALNVSTVVRELGRTRETANAFVIAGFIEPKVYATEAEAVRNDGVWVEDIDVSDRLIFMAACEGSWEDAVAVLTPFRAELPGDVEGREAGGEVPRTQAVPYPGVEEEAEEPLPSLRPVAR